MERQKKTEYLIKKKNWNTIVWAQCGCFYESSDVTSISEITLTALYDVHTGTIIDRHRLSRKDCQILDPKKLCCFPYSSWLEKTKEQVWIKSYSSASYFVNCWKGIGPSEAQSVTTKFTLLWFFLLRTEFIFRLTETPCCMLLYAKGRLISQRFLSNVVVLWTSKT